jgi:hypothetical protein
MRNQENTAARQEKVNVQNNKKENSGDLILGIMTCFYGTKEKIHIIIFEIWWNLSEKITNLRKLHSI